METATKHSTATAQRALPARGGRTVRVRGSGTLLRATSEATAMKSPRETAEMGAHMEDSTDHNKLQGCWTMTQRTVGKGGNPGAGKVALSRTSAPIGCPVSNGQPWNHTCK